MLKIGNVKAAPVAADTLRKSRLERTVFFIELADKTTFVGRRSWLLLRFRKFIEFGLHLIVTQVRTGINEHFVTKGY